MVTIWEKFYKGLSIEDIKKINPFACPDWLKNGADLSLGRKIDIDNLFNSRDKVPASRIRELIRNRGRYAAFCAIVHGFAYHDGEGELVKIGGKEAKVSLGLKKTVIPTRESANSVTSIEKESIRPSVRANESTNVRGQDIDGIRQVIEKKGQY